VDMKAELTLSPEFVDSIADKVIEKLKPLVADCSKHDAAAVSIFDKKDLASYLKVSGSTINKLVSNKQIPYFKIQAGQSGGVRFQKKDVDKWIAKHAIPI
jgi:excisionase family DNA binding protein